MIVFLLKFIDRSKINTFLQLRNPLMLKLQVYISYSCQLYTNKSMQHLKNVTSKINVFPFILIVEGYIVADNLLDGELLDSRIWTRG